MRRYVFFTNGPNLPPRGCFGTGFQARTSIFDFFSKTCKKILWSKKAAVYLFCHRIWTEKTTSWLGLLRLVHDEREILWQVIQACPL